MAQRLSNEQLTEAVARLHGWRRAGDEIRRDFTFESFVDAMIFVNRVAELAEEVEHHPDIDIRYNRVALALTSHDAGGLTNRDFQLAKRVDELASV